MHIEARIVIRREKSLFQKFLATCERALQSGERSVVKDLTSSNWKNLTMMSQQHSELQ